MTMPPDYLALMEQSPAEQFARRRELARKFARTFDNEIAKQTWEQKVHAAKAAERAALANVVFDPGAVLADALPSSRLGESQYRLANPRGSRIVLRVVANWAGFTPGNIIKDDRSDPLVLARHVAYWVMRAELQLSFNSIATFMKRDHSSVHYGVDRIQKKIDADPEFARVIATIVASVRRALA